MLPIPPSASAGLRDAPRAVVTSAPPAVTEPVPSPERRTAAPRAARIKLDRPLVVYVSRATVRLPAKVRLAMRDETRARHETRTEICTESQGTTGGESPPIAPSRTTLAAVPQPIVTP